ncbi:MAG: MaoC family dehydratase [Candidatus Bathyarchaeia archaeon]
MRGLYYEDFQQKQLFESPTRTITESDLILFGSLTQDTSPIQMDEEFAKKTQFRGRIAHGLLTQSLAVGLTFGRLGLFEGTAIALLGFDNVRFKKPVRIGDTIRASAQVTNKKLTSKKDRGLVVLRYRIENQRELVAEFDCLTLVQKKPKKTR